MQAITTKTRGLFVTHFRYTVIIATVSYQYFSYLYYRDIHLHRYILCYFLLTYDDYVILIMFYFKPWFSYKCQIWSFVVFLRTTFCSRQSDPLPSIMIISNKCRNQVPVIKVSQHWNKEYYRRSADCCEGDLDLDINCLDSDNLWKYTTVPIQCEKWVKSECGIFCILVIDII